MKCLWRLFVLVRQTDWLPETCSMVYDKGRTNANSTKTLSNTISHKFCIYMDVFLSIILKLKPAFVDWLWPPNKLKGECKLNHMKMIRGKAFMEGRAPSCEANAINATGCNSININGKKNERRRVWKRERGMMVNLEWAKASKKIERRM